MRITLILLVLLALSACMPNREGYLCGQRELIFYSEQKATGKDGHTGIIITIECVDPIGGKNG